MLFIINTNITLRNHNLSLKNVCQNVGANKYETDCSFLSSAPPDTFSGLSFNKANEIAGQLFAALLF